MKSSAFSLCGVRRVGWLVAAGLALVVAPARAQSSKATFPWATIIGVQANYLTSRNHALLLRARLERSFDSDYNALDRSAGGGLAQRAVVLGGYEWRLSERWSGGLVEKITFDPGPTRTFQTGGFLRHCGHIGSVQFRKRVLAEHAALAASGQSPPDQGRVRIRADLDRTWRLGTLGLRPRVAAELQFDISFEKRDAAAKAGQRTVDRALLRAELAVEVTDQLSFVPYVVRQTEFTTAIAQFDADGNVKVPAGSRNLRYPAVGLDVRYTLLSRKPYQQPVNRDLPTFEGFQD